MTPRSAALILFAATAAAQNPQPRPVQPGQQLIREGKLSEALALYQQTPDSVQSQNAAGVVLDLMGRYPEARQHFTKAIEMATTPQAKANAERSLAMSYAFEGNCKETVNHEQKVLDYWVAEKDFYQQGEIANEAARVCIDSGDLDTAAKWYQIGHDRGMQEPDIKPDRKDLWEFRTENALARIAARRGKADEAQRHVAAAKAALDRGTNPAQMIFLPYLTGYVAFYLGDYKTALAELQKANQSDPFIQCLIGQTNEKLGQKENAMEAYRKAAATTAHNPPAAYARPFATRKLASW
jgi:tetratricopeptide (TPR) repeat protein